ncbi:hypothetical protein EZ216_18940 [Ramlibacter humi]|uniref:Uncharacterized protein n=1 Tax=Ramlibacter humi TaxID=2530451 RepID=A0A4Z0BD79_9BURK|nr:hypothetical protein EZ216_18940 [Ramlibacter humi]
MSSQLQCGTSPPPPSCCAPRPRRPSRCPRWTIPNSPAGRSRPTPRWRSSCARRTATSPCRPRASLSRARCRRSC